MNEIGRAALLLLCPVAAYGAAAGFAGAFGDGRLRLAESARRATYAAFFLALLGVGALEWGLLSRDFANLYVYQHTSRDLSFVYTISALWAGNAGSLLLWLLLLTFGAALLSARSVNKKASVPGTPGHTRVPDRAFACAASVVTALVLCFALVAAFLPGSNAFATLPAASPAPQDGAGLNPLLLNAGMVIHPLTVYLGFVGLAVPFALVMGALLARAPEHQDIMAWTRSSTVFAWLFLTLGNIIGAWWAYVTLGWGGYWTWDPVESASLMPWLLSTGLLHSLLMPAQRLRLTHSSVWLAVGSFLLTLFAVFVTRSGIAESVHAFTGGSAAYTYGVLPAAASVFSLLVVLVRREQLGSPGGITRKATTDAPARDEALPAPPGTAAPAMSTRRAALIAAVLLFAATTAVILFGVVSPLLGGLFGAQRAELGPPTSPPRPALSGWHFSHCSAPAAFPNGATCLPDHLLSVSWPQHLPPPSPLCSCPSSPAAPRGRQSPLASPPSPRALSPCGSSWRCAGLPPATREAAGARPGACGAMEHGSCTWA